MTTSRVLLTLTMALCAAVANAGERILTKEAVVTASLDDVWHAWTTADGLKFISANSNVVLKRGGQYEWFLDGEADERGKRGGEGSRILAYLPKEMIAFTWTFPPDVAELRNADATTQVVVRFADQGDGTVRVRLAAHEWQDGPSWQAGWDYFDVAWGIVLDALQAHFDTAKTGNS